MNTSNNYRVLTELDAGRHGRNVFYARTGPAAIWKEVAARDTGAVSQLTREMQKLVYSKAPKWIINGLAWLLYKAVYRKHGLFLDESDFWADRSGNVARHLMAFLQRQYTLAHAACSAVCMWDERHQEMVCVRSLDWAGADDLAACTRIFKFFDDASPGPVFQAAGVAGMVGILTGMKDGFSLCINYAPWHFAACFKPDPLFAIRNLLQDTAVQTYDQAKHRVKHWRVAAPCFITICGRERGEACVIECGARKNRIRSLNGNSFIVQTNHFNSDKSPYRRYRKHFYYTEEPPQHEGGWYGSDLMRNSKERRRRIESHVQTIPPDTDCLEEEILKIYLVPPVLNYETAQWVVMRPKSNVMKVFTCTAKPAGLGQAG